MLLNNIKQETARALQQNNILEQEQAPVQSGMVKSLLIFIMIFFRKKLQLQLILSLKYQVITVLFPKF
jgi:hypothetical protein